MRGRKLEIHALPGLPEVSPGADIATLAVEALRASGVELRAGDVLVVAQKIVSKAEGRFVDLAQVKPSDRATRIAAEVGKDARFVEVVLRESCEVIRTAPNVLITRHRLGFVMANAGVDHSNVGAGRGDETVLLLPADPDTSALNLRTSIEALCGVAPGIVISDSFGRPWRLGVVNVALGVAGLPSIVDLRGNPDRDGRRMQVTQVAVADSVAAAAGLVMGEAADSAPVVHLRGLDWSGPLGDGQQLVRPLAEDLFR